MSQRYISFNFEYDINLFKIAQQGKNLMSKGYCLVQMIQEEKALN